MKDIKDLLPNTAKVKKDPKDINLKDLINVDYTDNSWPEDEEGLIAYQYTKRESAGDYASKIELNAELRRVNDRIKFLRAAHYGSALPKEVAIEINTLNTIKKYLLSQLKENEIIDEASGTLLNEALNLLQRMRRRAIMRKNKAKIMMGRRRAQRKRASNSVLQQRAIRAARSALARKILRKDKGEASYSEKVRVEKALASRQGAIKALARRMLSKIRQKERQRFQKKNIPAPQTQPQRGNK